jgi:2-polyprenyl-6-methoxyphenol hydroxylase-like FAD-dependent oxidoreductase
MAIDNLARSSSPQIAIIGGGIVGVMLTLGLLRQNVSVRLYEQSGGFREIGAGIAFSACARRCSAYTLLNRESRSQGRVDPIFRVVNSSQVRKRSPSRAS